MGTSKSFNGPGGRPPLLPPWAIAPIDEPSPEQDPNVTDADEPTETEAPESPDQTNEVKIPESVGNWSGAKRSFGYAISDRGNSGGGNAEQFSRAGHGYVKALGGSKRAASSATSGRRATQALGGFLSDAATRGLGAAMESIGLGKYVGQDPEVAASAITNAIAPNGDTRDEAAARFAINEAMAELYKNAAMTPDAATGLSSITAEAMVTAMKTAVSSFIYRRWVSDLGIKIEQNAISRQEAVRLEKEVKTFVRDAVKFDTQGKDILKMNWNKGEGRALIDKVYGDAYEMLGGGES